MKNNHEGGHSDLHVAFKITKLVLQAASVAAAFCIAKEIHRVHRSIEKKHEHGHRKLL